MWLLSVKYRKTNTKREITHLKHSELTKWSNERTWNTIYNNDTEYT